MPPAAPMRFITAFALLRSGFIVTSGISATAGLRKVAMLSSTISSTATKIISGVLFCAVTCAA